MTWLETTPPLGPPSGPAFGRAFLASRAGCAAILAFNIADGAWTRRQAPAGEGRARP